MKPHRSVGLSMVTFVFAALAVHGTGAQPAAPRTKIDVSKLGPQVGGRVPDFRLSDQFGRMQTLQSIMGAKGAMLVFIRSADWCPYCKTQMIELQNRVQDLKARGLGVAVISYDPVEILSAFTKQHGISFLMLSDVGSATIKRYGILNTVAMELAGPNAKDPAIADDIKTYVSVFGGNARMAGIAFPGTFMLDRSGRVTSRFFEDSYITRTTVASVLLRAGRNASPVSATKIATEYLDVTAYPSDTSIAPGNRITLAFDIVPHAGVHVYAPGALGYRVIDVKLDAEPAFRVFPTKYPPSQIYFFKPLKERVPVYERPFTLQQDVELDGMPTSQAALRGKETVSLSGRLNYQACDAQICFNPVSVPMSWTFTLRPILTERRVP